MKNNKTLLDYLRLNKAEFIAPCNGNKTCGKCKVRLSNRKIKPNDADYNLLSEIDLEQGYILACNHEYQHGDIIETIDISGEILKEITYKSVINNHHKDGYGAIVDIGTTTVVIKWIELKNGKTVDEISFFNPQTTYGSDVIARIGFDSKDVKNILHQLIKDKIYYYLDDNKIKLDKLIVVGNTTMIHLFLNLPVVSLGKLPFLVPEPNITRTMVKTNYQSFEMITLPHIGAYVGSDIISGIIAANIDRSPNYQMLVDLGTNGEITLGNQDIFLVTSTAAGPAFEGVNISCGGPSIDGAINKIKIKNNQVEIKTIGNKKSHSICGSGLISIISELRKNGLISEMGRFNNKQDKFYLTGEIYISEKDIQAFQLAKGAIQSGINILLKEVDDVEKIYISGGFGNHLDIDDLIELKIIKEEYRNKIEFLANSALSGAYVTLINQDLERTDKIKKKSKLINLAKHSDFNDELMDSLYF